MGIQTYKIALAMHRAGRTNKEIAEAMNIRAGSASNLVKQGIWAEQAQQGWLSELSPHVSNALKRAGYEDKNKLGDAFKSGKFRMAGGVIPGIGIEGMRELESVLRPHGIYIRPARVKWMATASCGTKMVANKRYRENGITGWIMSRLAHSDGALKYFARVNAAYADDLAKDGADGRKHCADELRECRAKMRKVVSGAHDDNGLVAQLSNSG